MSDNAIGVVGVDGVTPLYNPDGRWAMWSSDEIYMGGTGLNKYIPKINDYVVTPLTGELYIVTDLDNVTFVPELTLKSFNQTSMNDSLISSTGDNYRVYIDKSVTPYTLSVDSFLRTYDPDATVARIYKGSIIDPSKVISRKYDNSGNFISHDIVLQLVAMNSHDNYGIKSIPTCNTNEDLKTGDLCSIVIFSSLGKVIGKVTCIAEETTYIPQAYAEQKYITKIYMKSAFIPTLQPGTVNYPVNLPVASFNPIGVVQYNDGSTIEYPVDGDKFTLIGLDQFVSSIIGHRVPLVLKYNATADEATIDGSFTVPYTLIVSNANTSYNVKLYVYPVWIDAVNGYNYKVYLMNLDRNVLFDVTNLVSLSATSPSFNPTAYGITQRLVFNINLAAVSGIYNNYLHVQTVDIVLRAPANDAVTTNIWEVSSQVPTTIPYYGTNLRAIRDNVVGNKIDIDNDCVTSDEFLNKLYYSTLPLYNPERETAPLTPTHIEVRSGTQVILVPIEEYDNTFQFTGVVPMYSNIDIVFLKQTISDYLKLSIASLTVR